MSNDLTGKYFVRKSTSGTWEDIATKFSGCRILSITGLDELGDAINVFRQQWMDGSEDVAVTEQDGQGNDVIRRANVDIRVTLIVSRRYSSSAIDEQTVWNSIKTYMCKQGSFYIKSSYDNLKAHVICLKSVKPTDKKLNRGEGSFILATIELHCMEEPSAAS